MKTKKEFGMKGKCLHRGNADQKGVRSGKENVIIRVMKTESDFDVKGKCHHQGDEDQK